MTSHKTVYNKHGHPIRVKTMTVVCKRCNEDFTCEVVTRTPAYCPQCRDIIAAEHRQKNNARMARLRERRLEGTAEKPRRLIRYAGYDEKERP